YNWKHQNPPFSENPQALISLLESIFHTHDPTWDDCQQLLQALFTSEERERIWGQAVRSVPGGPEGPLDDQQQARYGLKLIHLGWPTTMSWWWSKAVHQLQSELHDNLRETMPGPSEKSLQPLPYKLGDLVFILRFDSKTLEPSWEGPFPVVLVTPSAVKVAGHSAWISRSHLKAAPPEEATSTWRI
ncbi:Gag polyprotein, partial [Heterocephalus glaber]